MKKMSERVTCIMVSERCSSRESDTFGSFIAQDYPNTELLIVHKSKYPVVIPVCVNRNVRVITSSLKLGPDETVDHAMSFIDGGLVCVIQPGTIMLPWHLSSMSNLAKGSSVIAVQSLKCWLYANGRFRLGVHKCLDLWMFDTNWAKRIGFARTKGHVSTLSPIVEFAESTGAYCSNDDAENSSLIVMADTERQDDIERVHRVLRPGDPSVWHRSLLGQMDENMGMRSRLTRRFETCQKKSS